MSQDGDSLGYRKEVGRRIRDIRRQRKLSLQDVEAESQQEFKASVLGAYERGERAISVPRLQRLARFYSAPVDQLLPRDLGLDPAWGGISGGPEEIDLAAAEQAERRAASERDERVTIDLTKLEGLSAPERDLLGRYLGMIQVQRQDFNGRVLTIRSEDLRAIACLFETSADNMRRRLAGRGREHDPEAVRRAVAWAADAGFTSYNVDLIFGAAAELDEDWTRTLEAALALDPPPPHVSAYALTVEPGTPLASDPARHPDDDDQAGKYLTADAVLCAAGLSWYEISNWARPGHECRHNLLYWAQGDYRGIGCAAHSHHDGRRWWNVRTPERYIALIEARSSPVAGEERLDVPARSHEALELALRT